jgi:predicted MFS family arabinose efflux permease
MHGFTPLRIALAGMAALAVAMGIGRFAFTPILPMMQEDFGLSVTGGGWLASSNYSGYLLGALAATAWPLRNRGVLTGSLFAVALSTFAMGFDGDFAVWAVLRFAAGLASALMFIAVSTRCIAALAARGRPTLTGLVFAGVGSGIAAAGLLCLMLMQYGAGSAWAWRIAGLAALLAALFVLPVLGTIVLPPAPAATAASRGSFGSQAGVLVLCYGISGFGYIIPATFLPLMAKAVVADVSLFGWSWPVFGAAAVASTFIAAAGAARIGQRRVWIASHWLMAAGVVLPAMLPGLAAVIASALLVGGTFVVTTMTSLQVAQAVSRGNATRLVAAMTAAFALGQIIGPVVAGLLFDAGYGFSGGQLLAGALLALSALLLWRSAPERTR